MLLRILTSIIVAGFVFAGTVEAGQSGNKVRKGRILNPHDMTKVRPRPPRDIYRPSGERGARTFDLATFAWLQFIALNAPANPNRRGRPGGSFLDSGSDPGARLVWETYQHRSELFPFVDGATGPVPPQPWNAPPKYVYEVNGDEYQPENTDDLFNNLDEASQVGNSLLFFPALNASESDQQVFFEAKVNRREWGLVNRLADGRLTTTSTIDMPNGSIEVKGAWVPIDAIPPNEQYRFHTSTALYYVNANDEGKDDGTDNFPVATTGEFALIGLHIIQKTRNYPTWIYASFEHRNILTSPTSGKKRGVYYVPSYDDVGYELPPTTTLGDGTVVNNPDIRFNIDRPKAIPNGRPVRLPKQGTVLDVVRGAVEVNGNVHVPVAQPPTMNLPVKASNWWARRVMSRLPGFDKDFVWQYYRLKGVQALPTNRARSKDFYLANLVIESVQPGLQLWRGGNKTVTDTSTEPTTVTAVNIRNQVNVQDPKQDNKVFSVGGCMGCHGVAATKFGFDHSYLFFAMDGAGYSPQTAGIKTQATMLERIRDFEPEE